MKTCQGIRFSSKRFSKHGSVIWNTFIFLAIILTWSNDLTSHNLDAKKFKLYSPSLNVKALGSTELL